MSTGSAKAQKYNKKSGLVFCLFYFILIFWNFTVFSILQWYQSKVDWKFTKGKVPWSVWEGHNLIDPDI